MSFVPSFTQENQLYLKVFISGLPQVWSEQQTKQLLQKYGQVLDLNFLKKDENLCANVKYAKMQDGEKAIKELSGVDKSIMIRWADGEKERLGIQEEWPAKLQVDGLSKDCDEHQVRDVFERYGQVTDVQIQSQSQTTAYISYTFKESCLKAIQATHGKQMIGERQLDVRFVGQPATIFRIMDQQPGEPGVDPIRENTKSYTRWLDSKKKPIYIHWETGEIVRKYYQIISSVNFGSIIYSPDGSKEIITKEKYLNDLATFNSKRTGPPGANLFVFHLPNEHKDSDLMELFSPYGNVISARVMTEPRTGKSKGFGFVSFDSPESAQKAKEAMDGHLIDKKKLSVTFKQNDGTFIQPIAYTWLPTVMNIQFDPFDL